MKAVVSLAGHQFIVGADDTIELPSRVGAVGDKIPANEVVLVTSGGKVAKPGKHAVTFEVIAHRNAKRETGFKYKRRKKYRRHFGIKRTHTLLRVTKIKGRV